MQKLKMSFFHLLESLFTCFLKDKTLHNHWDYAGFTVPIITYQVITGNYSCPVLPVATIPIITYQVITGNYSRSRRNVFSFSIITYQVITGNYSLPPSPPSQIFIITYQVITGNYSHNFD